MREDGGTMRFRLGWTKSETDRGGSAKREVPRSPSLTCPFLEHYRQLIQEAQGDACLEGMGYLEGQDLVQEAALKILISRAKSGKEIAALDPDHCRALFHRVIRQVRIDSWRKETGSGRFSVFHADLWTDPVVRPGPRTGHWKAYRCTDGAGDFFETMEPGEFPGEVMSWLQSELDEMDRMIIFLRVLMGMDWREVAGTLGMTEEATRSRFCRLRSRLAALWREETLERRSSQESEEGRR